MTFVPFGAYLFFAIIAFVLADAANKRTMP